MSYLDKLRKEEERHARQEERTANYWERMARQQEREEQRAHREWQRSEAEARQRQRDFAPPRPARTPSAGPIPAAPAQQPRTSGSGGASLLGVVAIGAAIIGLASLGARSSGNGGSSTRTVSSGDLDIICTPAPKPIPAPPAPKPAAPVVAQGPTPAFIAVLCVMGFILGMMLCNMAFMIRDLF